MLPLGVWLPGLILVLIVGAILWEATVDSLADIEVDVRARSDDCLSWVTVMRDAGFRVRVRVIGDRHWAQEWQSLELPFETTSCHIAHQLRTDRYVLVGDVPAQAVRSLFGSRPPVHGLIVRMSSDRSGSSVWTFGGTSDAAPWPQVD